MSMLSRRPAGLALAMSLTLSLVVLAACGDDDSSDETSSTTSAASESSSSAGDDEVVSSAVDAANAFLDSLDATTREATLFEYDDLAGKEGSWSNLPVGIFSARQGARMGDLDDSQREAALAVVDSLLSSQGEEQVDGILAADDYLGSNTQGGPGADEWTSDNYWLAFYGEPSTDEPWTMQFGGHHLAIHVSVGGDTLSFSPYFKGVEPTSFTQEGTEYAPLAEENEAVFGLLGSFDEGQSTSAELSGSFEESVMGPQSDTDYPDAEGISFGDLSTEQQDMVREIIGLWVEDADPAVSESLMETYESQLADTVIGWAGSTDGTAQGAYFRLDGPRLWIEYVNAGGIGTQEIHYHTVYRDKEVDYGTGAS